jgi:hypothetical protein
MSFSPQKGFITDRNTPQFHQLSEWLVLDDPAGNEAGYGVVKPFGCTVKFSKTTLVW